MIEDIEIIDAERPKLDLNQLRLIMEWSWGDLGVFAADLWQALNERHWKGTLDPTPIWFPSASPYGRWVGKISGNHKGQTQHIQIVRGRSKQEKADILFHEMIHQYLFENSLNPNHNAEPWCDEIMRLSLEIWGTEIWASPSNPRKVKGKSARIQKLSLNGETSLPLKKIASWPDSISLNIPISDYL
jgi:hypothetical protein